MNYPVETINFIVYLGIHNQEHFLGYFMESRGEFHYSISRLLCGVRLFMRVYITPYNTIVYIENNSLVSPSLLFDKILFQK